MESSECGVSSAHWGVESSECEVRNDERSAFSRDQSGQARARGDESRMDCGEWIETSREWGVENL